MIRVKYDPKKSEYRARVANFAWSDGYCQPTHALLYAPHVVLARHHVNEARKTARAYDFPGDGPWLYDENGWREEGR